MPLPVSALGCAVFLSCVTPENKIATNVTTGNNVTWLFTCWQSVVVGEVLTRWTAAVFWSRGEDLAPLLLVGDAGSPVAAGAALTFMAGDRHDFPARWASLRQQLHSRGPQAVVGVSAREPGGLADSRQHLPEKVVAHELERLPHSLSV